MTYLEALRYLESFVDYERIVCWPYKKSLKLGRIKYFLSILDNPHNNLRCLHVAGTKGKGSTCAFIAHILREKGFKTGLYTSPHLSDFRERIRILRHRVTRTPSHKIKEDFEGMITRPELARLVERLRPAIDEYNRNSRFGRLSFFEVYTALAFVYFKEKKADFLVLETGLGGRLDATNVVDPLVCAITPISYEHMQKLGYTLREIATEKAGIIKRHRDAESPIHQTIVISAPQEKEVQVVIRQKCEELKIKLYEVNKDIIFEGKNTDFSIRGIFNKYQDLRINFFGRHQLINASVAAGVIEALGFYGIDPDINSIRRGFYQTVWPGRCEVISRNPWVVLDGAQNVASARALRDAIRESFYAAQKAGNKKLILVFGISRDKEIKDTCTELSGLADAVILTKSRNPRAQPPELLAEYFRNKQIYITQSVREAKQLVKGLAGGNDLVLVTGSLFVVGEFRDGNP